MAERELSAMAAAAAAREREILMEEADSLEDGYTSEDSELYRDLDASTMALPSRGPASASGSGRMGAGGGGVSSARPTSGYARNFFEDSEVRSNKNGIFFHLFLLLFLRFDFYGVVWKTEGCEAYCTLDVLFGGMVDGGGGGLKLYLHSTQYNFTTFAIHTGTLPYFVLCRARQAALL